MNEKQASVAARIAELSSLPIAELWPVWDRYFSSRPINPNRVFIESRIAYKMQEEASAPRAGFRWPTTTTTPASPAATRIGRG